MSEHMNMFLRADDAFIPFGSYKAAELVTEALYPYSVWNKLRPLTKKMIQDILDSLAMRRAECDKAISNYNDYIQLIMNAQNTPLQEKLEIADSYKDGIADFTVEIEALVRAIDFFAICKRIILDYAYLYNGSKFSNDENHYIYFGIEAKGEIEEVEE